MKTYKLTKEDRELIEKAKEIIVKSKQVNLIDTSEVGSALITSKGNIFQGVNIGFYCGIGSCAEYQAIGNMISNGEKEIKKIASVYYDEKKKKYEVIPPCGKCREMIHQLGKNNWDCEVIISDDKKVKLTEILPYAWDGTIERK
jgi:cytidine deaminase